MYDFRQKFHRMDDFVRIYCFLRNASFTDSRHVPIWNSTSFGWWLLVSLKMLRLFVLRNKSNKNGGLFIPPLFKDHQLTWLSNGFNAFFISVKCELQKLPDMRWTVLYGFLHFFRLTLFCITLSWNQVNILSIRNLLYATYKNEQSKYKITCASI